MKIVVIGGGAAGFFGAIVTKSLNPEAQVIIVEKTRQLLAKVKVSGGGRCNVTHNCFEPKKLMQGYPRGAKELHSGFYQFQPSDMIEWLESRGVRLKAEPDGRMFPVTNSSQTIIDCFKKEAETLGVEVLVESEVLALEKGVYWKLLLRDDKFLEADKVLVATGSVQKAYEWLKNLGHTIVPPVPSLFTFTIQDPRIEGLAGVSVETVELEIVGHKQKGPLLITHWGLSGPAILKSSAWVAQALHECGYQATLRVNFIPGETPQRLQELFQKMREKSPKQQVGAESIFGLPRQLWKKLVEAAGIPKERVYAQLSKDEGSLLAKQLTQAEFSVTGKSTNKEEFVTCGGVSLEEVDFRRMESKIVPGLYFAGEVLNIDGITGGFNFQSAWTTAWIAAHALAT